MIVLSIEVIVTAMQIAIRVNQRRWWIRSGVQRLDIFFVLPFRFRSY
ncbi:unannotated protein [freshwater metagenome]|uniref:Unannotated protein n=1 Tax=freshwater metagenome TaxID=449393 RepID=A0A6J6GTP5_9ZZZZ